MLNSHYFQLQVQDEYEIILSILLTEIEWMIVPIPLTQLSALNKSLCSLLEGKDVI